jgi:hypothetical protein
VDIQVITLPHEPEHFLKLWPISRLAGNLIRKCTVEFQTVKLAVSILFFARNSNIAYFLSIHVMPLTVMSIKPKKQL